MTTTQLQTSGIARAVARVGSQAALAELLRSRFPEKRHPSQQAVSQWVRRGFAPLSRAHEISEISGVPVVDLVAPEIRALFARSTAST